MNIEKNIVILYENNKFWFKNISTNSTRMIKKLDYKPRYIYNFNDNLHFLITSKGLLLCILLNTTTFEYKLFEIFIDEYLTSILCVNNVDDIYSLVGFSYYDNEKILFVRKYNFNFNSVGDYNYYFIDYTKCYCDITSYIKLKNVDHFEVFPTNFKIVTNNLEAFINYDFTILNTN